MNRNPLRPIRRWIADQQEQIENLQTRINQHEAQLADQAAQIAALVRDGAQIEALRRIATATEYISAAEKHDRQANLKRHEF